MKGLIFDDSLVELIRAKGYKDSSIKQYSISVKRLANVLTQGKKVPKFVTHDYMRTYFVINSENVLSHEIKNINSLAACTYAAYIVLDCYELCDEAKYYKYLSKKYLQENSDNTIYREPNEKEQENYMTMEDVQNKFKELENKVSVEIERSKNIETLKTKYAFVNLYQRYLVCALYVHYPPLRGQDYYTAKLVRSEEDYMKWDHENVYDLRTGILSVRHHKTEGIIGIKKLVMPSKISELCLFWSTINTSDNLITNTRNGCSLSQQAFTALLNRIFSPHKVSSSMLRKIYISWFLNQSPSVEERKRIAKIMGHQIALQEFVYSRFRGL